MQIHDGKWKSTYLKWIWWEMMWVKSWRTDVSETTSFCRSTYNFPSNPPLEMYSFHLKSTKGTEIVVTDKHEFQGQNWWHFWEISDFQKSDASLKVEDL